MDEEIKIVEGSITRADLEHLAQATFKTMIKGVVDVERAVIAVGAALHADAEARLLEQGSRQKDVWGFNLKFEEKELSAALEYTSMINIRPHEGNMSMEIRLPDVRRKVLDIIVQRVEW